MTAKKITSNKSDFIRSQPASLPAAAVMAAGKKAGLKISSSLVYMVRGRAGASRAARGAKSTKIGPAKPGTGKQPSPAATAAAPGNGASKAAFVRSRAHLSPREIVEDAKAAGIELDVGYVYNVRGAARSKSKVTKQAARVVRVVAAPPVTTAKAEDLLRALGAELGLGRALEILQAERIKVRAVIRG
jgi:hypothetical protein